MDTPRVSRAGGVRLRVLVVDDDPNLVGHARRYLEEAGFEVRCAVDGTEMDRHLGREHFDLVVLNVRLPGEDGLSIARRVMFEHALPALILSHKGDDIERIVGLEIGADDYIAKPFNPGELVARIRATVRRSRRTHEIREGVAEKSPLYRFGPFTLDTGSHALARDGAKIELTNAEYKLLCVFVENCNRVLNRDQLMDLLKRHDRTPYDRSIDVRVSRLRQKIETAPGEPQYIRTVWGEGYLFSASVEVE